MRDSTIGIAVQCGVKSLDRAPELEGVQQCDRAVKFLLGRWIAGCCKMHHSQVFISAMLMLLRESACDQQRNQDCYDEPSLEH
jgi:hypothetical protein